MRWWGGCGEVERDYALVNELQLDNNEIIQIEKALVAESEEGEIKVARKEDLIWLKEQRNSEQDKVDVKKLKNEED